MLRVLAFNRRRVGAALGDRDLLGNAMLTNRFAQEPQRGFAITLDRQQEVPRGAGLIDSPIQIFSLDLHIRSRPIASWNRLSAYEREIAVQVMGRA
jgi:hypothetical protein